VRKAAPQIPPLCLCGKPVPAVSTDSTGIVTWKVTCGAAQCWYTVRRARAKAVFDAKGPPPVCPGCGGAVRKVIVPRSPGLNKLNKTCGNRTCIDVTRKLRKFKPRKCEHCAKKFVPVNGNHKRWCTKCSDGDKRSFEYLRECNMTYAEAQALLKRQGGLCALCPKLAVHLDHCHTTKKVRGWLCHGCNMHMAPIDKDPTWAVRALIYKQQATGLPDQLFDLSAYDNVTVPLQ
jgi:hypothetical protein